MKLRLLTLAVFLLGSQMMSAQKNSEYQDFLKAGVKLGTKEIVYSQLNLTSDEVEAFDKIFDTYLEKRSEIAKERLPIMAAYALNASTMSDEALKEFNAYLIKSNSQLNRLNKKYYNKARRAIPIKKATHLFLVEKILRDEVELEMLVGVFSF